jgi:hypothetical protein
MSPRPRSTLGGGNQVMRQFFLACPQQSLRARKPGMKKEIQSFPFQ